MSGLCLTFRYVGDGFTIVSPTGQAIGSVTCVSVRGSKVRVKVELPREYQINRREALQAELLTAAGLKAICVNPVGLDGDAETIRMVKPPTNTRPANNETGPDQAGGEA